MADVVSPIQFPASAVEASPTVETHSRPDRGCVRGRMGGRKYIWPYSDVPAWMYGRPQMMTCASASVCVCREKRERKSGVARRNQVISALTTSCVCVCVCVCE